MTPASNNLLLASADDGYNLTRSLRFRQSATAYLSRTFTSTGNRQIWTWSGWVKRGALSSGTLFGADGSNYAFIYFSPNSLDCGEVVSSQQWRRVTTQVFRDPSAWYHVVFAFDSTQATAGNRIKLYVNGSQVTAFSTSADPTLNYNSIVNTTIAHSIGSFAAPTRQAYLDGYLTEVNFIDGQALTPSSFGSTNTLTGVWQPAQYTGTYGTNGFYLPFTDNSALTTSSNVGLGKDFSGNGNYWATNNISITSGVTYDSMTDVPTLTSATAANFCVFNPLDCNANTTLSNGNLTASNTASLHRNVRCTIGYPTTGKFYHEVIVLGGASQMGVGIAASNQPLNSQTGGNGIIYTEAGNFEKDGSVVATGRATFTTNDIIGVAFDCGSNSVTFYKNNVSQGSVTPTTGYQYFPYLMIYNAAPAINFGQRPFAFSPPTGYVALNTFNLPTGTILKGNTVMDATTYTGNGSTLAVTNAAGFRPDLVWVKARGQTFSHILTDSVRGNLKVLSSDQTAAEFTEPSGITLTSTGFSSGVYASTNNNTYPYVGWQWQAGQGTTSSNTNGTITSTVSVNASAGFSVVTYTGTGVNATVGHGLGVAPSLIIIKQRSVVGNWQVYHSATGNTQSSFLNSTATPSTAIGYWNNTSPTSSVFSLGTAGDTNGSGTTYVAYCWSQIAGFSSIGSYVGNGSNDGVFVYTGFSPKWLLVKNVGQVNDWFVIDSAMNTYNVMGEYLLPNSSAASNTFSWIDFLSNGFKIRNTGTGNNNSGITQIYAAFASSPFKNSLAR